MQIFRSGSITIISNKRPEKQHSPSSGMEDQHEGYIPLLVDLIQAFKKKKKLLWTSRKSTSGGK